MIVVAAIIDGPIDAAREAAALAPHADAFAALDAAATCGAEVRFDGVVRRAERREGAEGEIVALDYEAYEPMAEQGLAELARTVGARHALQGIVVLHSRGRVQVGEVSFVLELHAAHRAPALAAMSEFIDALKRDVPIWKRPVWARD